MNVRKVAKEIFDVCKALKNIDGNIKASLMDDGRVIVYHAFGSTVQGDQGDNAQKAFDRVIYSIELREIDWKQPLLKYIEQELKEVKDLRESP